jgi:hypothetical protein
VVDVKVPGPVIVIEELVAEVPKLVGSPVRIFDESVNEAQFFTFELEF